MPIAAAMVLVIAYGIYTGAKTPPPALPTGMAYGQEVKLRGEITCLPHKNKSGPQTDECAIGLKSEELHYGLRDLDMESLMSGSLGTGKKVDVSGRLLRPNQNEKYDIVGTVDVTSAAPAP